MFVNDGAIADLLTEGATERAVRLFESKRPLEELPRRALFLGYRSHMAMGHIEGKRTAHITAGHCTQNPKSRVA